MQSAEFESEQSALLGLLMKDLPQTGVAREKSYLSVNSILLQVCERDKTTGFFPLVESPQIRLGTRTGSNTASVASSLGVNQHQFQRKPHDK